MSTDTYFLKKEPVNISSKKNSMLDISSLSRFINGISGLDEGTDSRMSG
jgi:hypothetical protein